MKTKPQTPTPDDRRFLSEDSEVASLLQAAGPRPAPPEEDKATIKAAALAQWQWTVRRERRRRRFRQGAVALAAAAALAFLAFHPVVRTQLGLGSGIPAGTLRIAVGGVLGGDGAELTPLAGGEELPPGFVLETPSGSGSGSTASAPRAVVELAGGSSLRLDAGSRLRLISSEVLALDRGALYVDSGREGKAVAIRTPLGEVRDIGTRFEVRLEPGETALRVRVRDGEVELLHAGRTHIAGAGEELLQRADGSLALEEVPPHGPQWAWVAEILPPFETDGRTLAEFLSWAAHEGGWELAYGEADLEPLAARVTLYGSIRGLSLDEALAAMLAGSDLTYRLEEGVLRVEKR